MKPERDPNYYFADGDIIILVEDKSLFKIHRFLLSRHSDIFRSAFSLPQPSNTSTLSEGDSDENPFVLYEETASRFRALAKVLYALPRDILDINNGIPDFQFLCDVASISHKFGLEAFETWTSELLVKRIKCQGYPSTFNFLPLLDYTLRSITQVELKGLVLDFILSRIKNGSIQYPALYRFADEKGHPEWKRLLALAFYKYAIKGPRFWDPNAGLPDSKQQLLYLAFASLTEVQTHGIVWSHHTLCSDQFTCTKNFQALMFFFSIEFAGDLADVCSWVQYVVLQMQGALKVKPHNQLRTSPQAGQSFNWGGSSAFGQAASPLSPFGGFGATSSFGTSTPSSTQTVNAQIFGVAHASAPPANPLASIGLNTHTQQNIIASYPFSECHSNSAIPAYERWAASFEDTLVERFEKLGKDPPNVFAVATSPSTISK